MNFKNIAVLVLVFCSIFECTVATGILLNTFKNTIQNTRCKLHNLGSKIIQHDHQSDPCAQPELGHEESVGHGNNDFGSSGHGNDESGSSHHGHKDFGSNGYGNNKYVSIGHGNNDFGSSGYGNHKHGSTGYGNNDFGSSDYGNHNHGSFDYGHNDFGSSRYGKNKFGSQNGYPTTEKSHGYVVTENLEEDRRNGYGEEKQHYSGHSHGSSTEQNSDRFEFASSTSTYQPTVKTDRNHIIKDTTNEGFGNFGQGANNNTSDSYNTIENQTEYIFLKPSTNNSPVDNFLPEIRSENYQTSTGKPSLNDNETMENVIDSIFGKPDDYNKKPEVTSEINPFVPDIDIRNGRKQASTTFKTYATVPQDGGRNIIKVDCPPGSTATADGECLYEFK